MGPDPTSPLYLASAYSTLAANGTRCDPTPVTAIIDRNGQPVTRADGSLYVNGDKCTPEAIPAGVATTMNQMMIGDTAAPYGTATRAAVPGHQVAGKTGTIQDNKSATFVGSTPRYTASVMVYNPKAQVDVGGVRREQAGGDLAGHDGADLGEGAHDAVSPGRPGSRCLQAASRARLLLRT